MRIVTDWCAVAFSLREPPIYARMTRRAHLAASDLMHGARGRDLEELLPEYVQPA